MTDTQSMSSPLPIKRVSVAGGASRMGIGLRGPSTTGSSNGISLTLNEGRRSLSGIVDLDVLVLCRVLVSATTSTRCWDGLIRGSDMHGYAEYHLAAARSVYRPVSSTIVLSSYPRRTPTDRQSMVGRRDGSLRSCGAS
jgi:hypothetical protein